jgi:hypothetical protein
MPMTSSSPPQRWAWLLIGAVLLPAAWSPRVLAQTTTELAGKALAGFDLPDYRVIAPVYGTVTYTIKVAATKSDGPDTRKADIIAQWVMTQTSDRWKLTYTANGTYVVDRLEADGSGRPCHHIDLTTISDAQTVLDFPISQAVEVGALVTSKKLGIARFFLNGVTTRQWPKCRLEHRGCNPCDAKCTEFSDFSFLETLRIPSYGAGGTKFSAALNAMEAQGKDGSDDLGSVAFIEGRFDGQRTTGQYTVQLLDGRTIPVWKASGEDLTSAMKDLWPATLTVSWNLGGDEQPTIKIVSPKPDEDQVFSSGKLAIKVEAKVEPSKYEKDVVWEVQDVQGSKNSVTPSKGAKVTIRFDGLPSDNAQFGEKLITAKVRGQQDQVKVRTFFERDAKDNPGKRDPNWFYYWRQGVVVGLEDFKYKTGGSYYDPNTDELVISDEAASQLPGGSVPLKPQITYFGTNKVCTVTRSITLTPTDGVLSAARLVAHELEHQSLFRASRTGRHSDKDLVSDAVELSSPFCLDPKLDNTHGINVGDGADGDNEVLAIDAESRSSGRAKTNLDWASPGSQSKSK